MVAVAVAVVAGGVGRQRIMTSEENMKSKLLGCKTLIASFAFILIACAVPGYRSGAVPTCDAGSGAKGIRHSSASCRGAD